MGVDNGRIGDAHLLPESSAAGSVQGIAVDAQTFTRPSYPPLSRLIPLTGAPFKSRILVLWGAFCDRESHNVQACGFLIHHQCRMDCHFFPRLREGSKPLQVEIFGD
jgi:hypothetical protein